MEDFTTNQLVREQAEKTSRHEVANKLGVTYGTVGRWIREDYECNELYRHQLEQMALPRFAQGNPADVDGTFTFIDLFAGIGGMRLGFQNAGGKCVFSSEWNEFARRTYRQNFGEDEEFAGDIVLVDERTIPDHDILLAGFPCQPFSIAGVSKKNALGIPHGFECTTQGTLFFDVERIIREKRPKAFLLENVKNLISHDSRRTFATIMRTLENDLGYKVTYRIVDGASFVPQHRERILIVGFREDVGFDIDSVEFPKVHHTMKEILHPEDGSEPADDRYTFGPKGKVSSKYTLSSKLWKYLQDYAAKHKAAGNGFGYGLVSEESVARTLSARYYKDGSEILVSRGIRANPRRLTPREAARLMGFPDDFEIPVSDTQAYKQFGNSVVVPVMETVAKAMAPYVRSLGQVAGWSIRVAEPLTAD